MSLVQWDRNIQKQPHITKRTTMSVHHLVSSCRTGPCTDLPWTTTARAAEAVQRSGSTGPTPVRLLPGIHGDLIAVSACTSSSLREGQDVCQVVGGLHLMPLSPAWKRGWNLVCHKMAQFEPGVGSAMERWKEDCCLIRVCNLCQLSREQFLN